MQTTPPHGIYDLLPPHFPWAIVIIVAALIALLAIAIFFYLRHRRPTTVTQIAVTPRDHLRDARAKIIRLKPPNPFPIGKIQENYFFALSVAWRELIEYRCQLPVIGATLREVTPQLQKLPLARTTIAKIEEFMQRADAIKFAAQPSNLEQAQQDHQQVLQWMQQLTSNIQIGGGARGGGTPLV